MSRSDQARGMGNRRVCIALPRSNQEIRKNKLRRKKYTCTAQRNRNDKNVTSWSLQNPMLCLRSWPWYISIPVGLGNITALTYLDPYGSWRKLIVKEVEVCQGCKVSHLRWMLPEENGSKKLTVYDFYKLLFEISFRKWRCYSERREKRKTNSMWVVITLNKTASNYKCYLLVFTEPNVMLKSPWAQAWRNCFNFTFWFILLSGDLIWNWPEIDKSAPLILLVGTAHTHG